MSMKRKRLKRLSVHITPQRRAEQLPDEFVLKGDTLYCRWCSKPLTSLRMDNLRLHLTSQYHKENKLNLGGHITINNISRKGPKNRARARARRRMRQKDAYDYTSGEDSSKAENESDEQLSQLFEESDSEDTQAFQGFDNDSDPSSKQGRPRKRPARLDNTFDLSRKRRKRKRSTSEEDTPIPLRSMPLKKQMSYTARRMKLPPSKKAKLKIKIRRRSQSRAKSFEVESSDADEPSLSVGRQVAAYKRSGQGLKMKFVLNKQQGSPHRKDRRKRSTSANYSSDDVQRYDHEQSIEVAPPVLDVYDQEQNVFHGVEELIEEEVVNDGMEVIEEEIVGVDDGEVVSWDAVVGDEEEEVVEEEVIASPETSMQPEPELTSEESLAIKANYAREMAKAVNSAQFKKKRLVAKKLERLEPKMEEKQKRKVSAYNLWSSRMRKQVATQYPGLQFGEVSKKLGNLWKKIPDKEKQMWKHRSDKMANRLVEIQSNRTKRNKGSRMIETGPKKKIVSPKPAARPVSASPFIPHKNPGQAMQRELQRLPKPSIEPIDAAAHFRILGQTLANLGNEMKKSRGKPATKLVSLLLDSLLCSIAPLLSLTNQIPQIEKSIPDTALVSMYSNIAHVMPGF